MKSAINQSTELAKKKSASKPEMIILVDEQDREVGSGEKIAVHRAGTLHRAFSVFILRRGATGAVELLLQRRAADKYHCGGLWTNTCCSHPNVNEAVADAAQRRLYEEVGITTKLYAVGTFCYRAEFANGLIEHELDHTFVGAYAASISISMASCGEEPVQQKLLDKELLAKINRAEIQDLKWLSIAALKHELRSNVQQYTPWLAPALALVERQQPFVNALLAGHAEPGQLLCLNS